MDLVLRVIVIALAVFGAIALIGLLVEQVERVRGRANGSAGSDDPVEDARAFAMTLEYEEISVEWLERNDAFQEQATRLAEDDIAVERVVELTRSEFPGVAALGYEALWQRDDMPPSCEDDAIAALASCPTSIEPFIYRVLERRAGTPVIGRVLARFSEDISWDALARFVEARQNGGEEIDAETFRLVPLRLAPSLETFVDRYESRLGPDFREHFEDWRSGSVDLEFLSTVGRVLDRPFDVPPAYLNDRRAEVVDLLVDAFERKHRRSVLLVGETGVGKTALLRAALERTAPHLVAFEAGATQIIAGASYIGELEGRIRAVAENLRGHDAIWILPAFEETVYAGQHSRSPKGMLDALLPHVERGDVLVVGEITPSALEALVAQRPRVAALFDVVRVRPLDESSAVAAAEHTVAELGLTASRETLLEAYDLAQQFLPGVASPGNTLRLLRATEAYLAEQERTNVEAADVLAALAKSSGLPLVLLDTNTPLDLDEVRAFFESRVLGQREAVDCLVERIAMTKAGLTDPTRPLGVFLFVGPTGTGKTEVAKALAEFMFGTERRLIRIDMSEFQTRDALDRLLQDTSADRRGSVLLSAVRKEPFAVVLLDEFEKAAPAVWDLFLQVFDDGRLTDQQGRTADFRRCIIILTSNIGSAVAHRPGVGFEAEHGRFRTELIERELKRSFRPEFLNRIDRVVVFEPFERAQMRALLDLELAAALTRRGLRGRPWAVELDDSTYGFLIERGFSPELGARPLKRAVERHLLAPIAAAIVEHAVPEGDQFLLVSAPNDDRIVVSFVDPDAPVDAEPDVDSAGQALDVRAVARGAGDGDAVVDLLIRELESTRAVVEGELAERKERALQSMQEPGFWEDTWRHAVLAEVEYLDRLEAAFETARSLARRLETAGRRNGRGNVAELAALLALRLHVLAAAVEGLDRAQPADALLRIRPSGDGAEEWADALAAMYAAWAERRGMRLRRLDRDEHVYSVTGLGAATLLEPETGLHVLESPRDGREGHDLGRVAASVQVIPDAGAEGDAGERAAAAFANAAAPNAIVRRYRREPSPLVRDSARGYRTGRLDRVLAGDFDLFGGAHG